MRDLAMGLAKNKIFVLPVATKWIKCCEVSRHGFVGNETNAIRLERDKRRRRKKLPPFLYELHWWGHAWFLMVMIAKIC
jgi:hypothetical protein